MSGESNVTTDHSVIRQWIEERNGKPATVKDTVQDNRPGVLRIDFSENSNSESVEEINWETFFTAFEENNLAFLYQEKTRDGKQSRFFKFIRRHTDEAA